MKRTYRVLSLLIILFLVTGCGVVVELPFKTENKTGPTLTDYISIPEPSTPPPVNLELLFGAGKMILLPHSGEELAAGTIVYNVEDFQPQVITEDNKITLKQGNIQLNAVPTLDEKVKNEWSLALSNFPLDLSIRAGAYSGDFEFGGLAISQLHIKDGASNVNIRFSTPNQTRMSAFRYETGASNISLEKLANANFQTMIFQSGAGNYNLDFSGTLQNDSAVFIETGLSRVTITVPRGVPAKVQFEGPLSKVIARGEWEQKGDDYYLSGEGYGLTFTVETKAGTVTLKNP